MKEINIDILSDGTIRFIRNDEKTNESLFRIISELAPSRIGEVKSFLDCSKQIEILFGKESMCG